MDFCILGKYKNALGKPGEGAHKYRFLNTAIVDYIMTIIGAIITAAIFKIPLVLTTIGLFVLSIILHILFGVETNVTKFLGIKCSK
jgi:hypothetical protein